MSGIELFSVGALLLCNAIVIGYLVLDNKRKAKPSSTEPKESDNPSEEAKTTSGDGSEGSAGVGKSSFDIDFLEAQMKRVLEDTVKETLPVLLNNMLGDVKLKDVEFADGGQESVESKPKFTAMSEEESQMALDTDIRDVVEDEPAAPSASGVSIDELENAVSTAVNPDATPEQQAEAGKILSGMQDTEFFDRITANDDIDRRVNLCIKMSIRAEIAMKSNESATPRVIKKKVETVVSDNLDDFNPADLLP